MVHICSDSSTMRDPRQAKEHGYTLAPLSVTIDGHSYRELEEIESPLFLEKIAQGNIPTSSQPALGEVVDMFESLPAEDEILHIAMADGLSGAYQSACTAAKVCEHAGKITVLNSRTLCVPHRDLVDHAVRLAAEGFSCAEIVARIEERLKTSTSFLIPADFDYLRRGGRLSPLVSYVGQAVRFVPVMSTTEDGRRLTLSGVKRGLGHAIDHIVKHFSAMGAGKDWLISVSHADCPDRAQQAMEKLQAAFPDAAFVLENLTPAFITQGGPGCLAVQIIHR